VLLYQICPVSGLDGSVDTDCIAVPRISLKVVIQTPVNYSVTANLECYP